MSNSAMNWAWQQDCKTASAKIVLVALADHHNAETQRCNPGLSRISERANLSRQGVLDQIERLEKAGFLVVIREKGCSNSYRLLVNAVDQSLVNGVDQSTALTSQPGRLPPVNGVDYHQSTGLTRLVNRVDLNRKEPEVEPELNRKKRSVEKDKGYTVPKCFESVEGFTTSLAAWIEHRKHIRKPVTGHAIQLFINRLAEKPQMAVKAMNETIERGWQTFKWEWLSVSVEATPEKPTPQDPPGWREWLAARGDDYVPHAKAMPHYREAFSKIAA